MILNLNTVRQISMNTIRILLIASVLISSPVTAGVLHQNTASPVQLSGVLEANDMRLINHPIPEQEIQSFKIALRNNT